MQLINGKKIAQELQQEIKAQIEKIHGRKPGLAFVLIGEDPPSQAYVRMKKKSCQEVGIHSEILELPGDISQEDILKEVDRLNQDGAIDGILIQQPLPKQISTTAIVEATDPEKDVDGFHPMNMGHLLLGEKEGFSACTPLGVVKLLQKIGFETKGKHAVIIGRSNIVGKPLAALLIQKGVDCTVTIAHRETKNLAEVCLEGDILIAAIGKAHFIKEHMVKKGAIVIDVGINRTDHGLVGDVDFERVKEKAQAITPVPGGVGPMTIAMLLSNTYDSYKKRWG
ncbi:MAG: bifunctional methylenetetrahydrofolate dehydrogenase/methenyltetrahydrofolate cyclohydrolase FolD [Candidatus Neptunochlamydia sp.]|nr:bifunctional methylenetetrahydrofolate dehydrogenase/methenyltetrahydrofolate cyclohydrolase FolD [Candidatus Neptunochlamydia sp.]